MGSRIPRNCLSAGEALTSRPSAALHQDGVWPLALSRASRGKVKTQLVAGAPSLSWARVHTLPKSRVSGEKPVCSQSPGRAASPAAGQVLGELLWTLPGREVGGFPGMEGGQEGVVTRVGEGD